MFSLNYHKHIHTGEGGMCCTQDDRLAERLRMIRNHAEAVVEQAHVTDLSNMVGFNFRLTELQAAVGIVQLGNGERHVGAREKLARKLSDGLKGLEGITIPKVRRRLPPRVLWLGAALQKNSRQPVARNFCAGAERGRLPLRAGLCKAAILASHIPTPDSYRR